MRIMQGKLCFEHLFNPSQSVVGEKNPIEVILSNAEDDFNLARHELNDIELLGRKACDHLKLAFKSQLSF